MAKIHVFLCVLVFAFCFVGVSTAKSKDYVGIYELRKGDFTVKLTNWGATVISVIVPDSKGNLADVALGFDSVSTYKNDSAYFGAIVGRVANRIGGAKFSLNGTEYKLVANEGKNMLHGGNPGFSDVIWTVKDKKDGESPYIKFAYHSIDGEQGFPGDLDVFVIYKLVGDYKLSVTMKAKPRNKPTPINLAQHTYWNLGGHNNGDILSNEVQLFASHYTPVDDALIPTGKTVTVEHTPYDFLQSHTIGSRIKKLPNGYDINYVLDTPGNHRHGVKKAAVVTESKSGRVMELWTNQPGLQFYTSNMLKDVVGKGGYVYGPHAALCLETQGFPDAVNHPNFPTQIVNPGQVYRHYMLYKFSSQ
eukprot:TRINITY_DN20899_c0_g1_i1.p1 TRINITY_DN20899_c0_g1~~TRINITY_DN20899_c0_g1_i1.p1  ORF type:complete len:394 (-),score=47.80 TRINITY_DN20899_c0_g1_i1:31-1113(-)